MTKLKNKISNAISRAGFITVDEFMSICLYDEEHGYYRTANPIGREGDFITAPEISQLFGEMIGVFIVDKISKNFPNENRVEIVELGAGRGALLDDVIRTISKFPDILKKISFNIVDVSEALIKIQKQKLAKHNNIKWFKNIGEINISSPAILIANEFYDALPAKQFVFNEFRWKERVIILENDEFKFSEMEIKKLPGLFNDILHEKPRPGSIKEFSENNVALSQQISEILNKNKGIFICFDYGYSVSAYGDTLQGLKGNKYANIFENFGKTDVTTHVDFNLIQKIFAKNNIETAISNQRDFLISMGIVQRAGILANNKNEETKSNIYTSLSRLIDQDKMGDLFKSFIAEKY